MARIKESAIVYQNLIKDKKFFKTRNTIYIISLVVLIIIGICISKIIPIWAYIPLVAWLVYILYVIARNRIMIKRITAQTLLLQNALINQPSIRYSFIADTIHGKKRIRLMDKVRLENQTGFGTLVYIGKEDTEIIKLIMSESRIVISSIKFIKERK